MLEYLTVDPKNLTVDPAWLAGVNSVNFGVNSEIYKNQTIDPSYSGRVNSELKCFNTFDGPDGISLKFHKNDTICKQFTPWITLVSQIAVGCGISVGGELIEVVGITGVQIEGCTQYLGNL